MSIATTIDLKLFCSKEPASKYSYDEPFVVAGWRYASDGRIGVRVPAPGEPDSERKTGTIAEAFTRDDTTPAAWPDTPFKRAEADCPTCEGYGYVGRKHCETCDGTGEHECPHCDQDMDCEDCDGKGFVTSGTRCPQCHGAKRFEQDISRLIGGLPVAAKYDALIRTLPGVQWAGTVPDKSGGYGRGFFLFDGGEGVVMSLRL